MARAARRYSELPVRVRFSPVSRPALFQWLANDQPVLIHEYPEAHVVDVNERYYPVPTAGTAELLKPYIVRAKELEGRIFFAGRLGDYGLLQYGPGLRTGTVVVLPKADRTVEPGRACEQGRCEPADQGSSYGSGVTGIFDGQY